MANRRMFSLDVVDTDSFLDMPLTAQVLDLSAIRSVYSGWSDAMMMI